MKPRSTTITNPASNTTSARVFATLAFLAALATLALVPVATRAQTVDAETVTAQIVSDFNDTPTEGRSNLYNAEKNSGLGIGYSGEWGGGSSVLQVTNTDLIAPESTRYAVVQPETVAPACVWGNYNSSETTRQLYRSLAKPLSGMVWGSFLVNNGLADHRTGLTFNLTENFGNNADTASSTGVRWLYAHGTTLAIRPHTFATEAITVPDRFILGVTALVLFSYDTVNQRLKVWVNPVLTDDPALLASDDTLAYDSATSGAGTPLDLFGSTGQLTRLGIVVTGGQASATNAGKIDSIRLDASAFAYFAVTGLPVPPDFARPAPVIADFNDTTTGSLGSPDTTTNDNKGIGFSSVKWDGSGDATSQDRFSSALQTGAEDLVAPASTRYAIVQSGLPHCVWVNNNLIINVRGAWRTLTTPLSGEVWGSFLVQNGKSGHRTGLYFNLFGGGGDAPVSHRSIIANGTSLIIYNHGGGEVENLGNVFTLGKTALVLFRINTTTLRITVWVNPVLPDNVAGLDDLTPHCDVTGIAFFGSAGVPLERIGIMATAGQISLADSASKIDALHLASGDTGYYSVTGLLAKPHITAQPQQSQTLLAGETATFSVAATSQWPLLYQWTRNGTDIPGATDASLTVENVTTAEAGDYQVLVSHSGGIGTTLSAAASLTVNVAPPDSAPAVNENSASNVTHNGFTATWGTVAGATGYQIEISTSLNFDSSGIVPGFEDYITVTGGDTQTHAVTGLPASTQYYYRVRATNDGGESGWSTAVPFTTIEAPPEGLVEIPHIWDTGPRVPGASAYDGYIATHWAGPDKNNLQIYAVSAMLDIFNEALGENYDDEGWNFTGEVHIFSVPNETYYSVTRVFQYDPNITYGTNFENLVDSATYDIAVEDLDFDLDLLADFWKLIQGTNVSHAEIGANFVTASQETHAIATENYPADDLELFGTPGLIPQTNGITFSGELPTVYETTGTITVGTITVDGGSSSIGDYTLAVVPSADNTAAAVTITEINAEAGTFEVKVINGSGTYQLIYGRAEDSTYAYVTAVTDEITTEKAAHPGLTLTGDLPTAYHTTGTVTITGLATTGTPNLESTAPEIASVAPDTESEIPGTYIVTVHASSGAYKLTYSQAAGDNYYATSGTTDPETNVTPGPQTTNPLTATYDGTLPTAYGDSVTITISGGDSEGDYTLVSDTNVVSITQTSTDTFIVTVVSGTGTYTLTYGRLGDNNYTEVISEEVLQGIAEKATQTTLTINSDAEITYEPDLIYNITTTGGSGEGAVTYEVITGGTGIGEVGEVGTEANSTLTITQAGTINLKATKAADANYKAATAEFLLTVHKADQPTVTLTGTPPVTGSATITIDAGAGTGNYTLVSTNTAVATVDKEEDADGNFIVTIVEGVTTGSYTLTYGRKGDANYKDATGLETGVIDLDKQSQPDDLAITDNFPTVFQMSETITVSGGEGTGAYTLISNNTGVATAVPVEGSPNTFTVTVISGTGSYTLTYGRNGDDDYNAAIPGTTDDITVGKDDQPGTVTLTGTPPTAYGDIVSLTVSGGEGTGGDYTLTSSAPGIAEVTITNAVTGEFKVEVKSSTGEYTLTYGRAGNDNYNPITDTKGPITVGKASQPGTVTLTGTPPTAYGDNVSLTVSGGEGTVGDYTLISSAPGIAEVTITNAVTGEFKVEVKSGTGEYTLTYGRAGNDNYNPITGTAGPFTVGKIAQPNAVTITDGTPPTAFNATAIITVTGGDSTGAYTLVSSDETVATVTPGESSSGQFTVKVVKGTASYTLTPGRNGDTNYTGSTGAATDTYATTPIAQTPALALSVTPPNTFADPSVTGFVTGGAAADVGGGGNYTITSSNTAVAEVELVNAATGEFTVTIKAATGTYTLNYTRAGNDNYTEASGSTGPIEIVVSAVAASLNAPVINKNESTITLEAIGAEGNYYALYASENLLGAAAAWTFVENTAGRFGSDGLAEITFAKGTATARFYRLVTSKTAINGSTAPDGTTLENNPNVKFSENVAGHYTVTIPAGASRLVALQLIGTENRIDKLFDALPNRSLVSLTDLEAGRMSATMKGVIGKWTNGALTLANGAAALVKNGSTTIDVELEFAGIVNTTDAKTHTFNAGQQILLAAHYPVAVADPAAFGYLPALSDTFNRLTEDGTYAATAVTVAGEWPDDTPPALNLAEGFFLRKAAGGTWTLPALILTETSILILSESDIEDTENTEDAGD